MTTGLEKRTQIYKIESKLTKRSVKHLKQMPSAEKKKLFSALEDFCVNGTHSPCYHGAHSLTGRPYLKPTTRSKYRIVISHRETETEAPQCYDGTVTLEVIIPRKELEKWLKQNS